MDNNKGIYKLYQLMNFFITKFSYTNVVIKGLLKGNEIWLANKTNPLYQVIRLSNDTLDETARDKSRVEEYRYNISRYLKMENPKFIDIHVGKEEVLEHEAFLTSMLDQNYCGGIDLNDTFPGIRNVIHEVDNEDQEIANIIQSISSDLKRRRDNKRRNLMPELLVTYAVMAICIINFVAYMALNYKYSQMASLIFLGADYKMFTLGCKEYLRLIICAFEHGSLMHLFVNMYSLYSLGSYYERKLGHLRFASMLFCGILTGSLTFGILSTNSIGMGLSGGLYCIFAYYILEVFHNGYYTSSSFTMLLVANIAMNFLPSTAWQAHLGGAVAGALFYFIFEMNKGNSAVYIPLILIMISVLGYKYLTQGKITPQYGATDMEVVEMLKDLGLNSYAQEITEKLIIEYTR